MVTVAVTVGQQTIKALWFYKRVSVWAKDTTQFNIAHQYTTCLATWEFCIIIILIVNMSNLVLPLVLSQEQRRRRKAEPMIYVSQYTNTVVSFKYSDEYRGGPSPLLQGDFFRPQGTEGLGNQAPLCLAWTARLKKCLALEALCTHERTHWKDIRLRWKEEARGAEKEKKRKARSLW